MTSLDDSFEDDSSDDEFLTVKNEGRSQDREAMIRRKLMESFYGKSIPQEQQVAADTDISETAEGETQQVTQESGTAKNDDDEEEEIQTTSDDLDSPYFDPDAHTSKYVLQANVHDVLEVEERLALQVRTLDSTMQTLVYENYSKFIDATDAIRSIGVSVHANEEGLSRLTKGIRIIDEKSRSVEDALGTLRDAVAEKLRIKRLLTRLDALLKLPTTLKQQISRGQYRLATKSYLSAHAILRKHSAGFESLKTIEDDCHSILTGMVNALKHKLLHWSGQTPTLLDVQSDDEDTAEGESLQLEKQEPDITPAPELPKSISEIFECASTLLIVLPRGSDNDYATDVEQNTGITFDSGLSGPECKAAALSAAIRYLERVLDNHQIGLQDEMFNTGGFGEDAFESALVAPEIDPTAPKESKLIPTEYLDSVLEAATLYGISFSISGTPSLNDIDRQLLMDFVSETFSAFLSHVRILLLECSVDKEVDSVEQEEKVDMMSDDDDGDEAYSEISEAMSHLLRAVRDLASGLALPDVGVDVDFASGLVEQAVVVTETMVRRRVSQKFMNLRVSVIQDCIAPFIKDSIKHSKVSDNARIVELVQMASVALSDGLQLVDDTVKSILTGGVVVSDLKGVDYAMVKEAVQSCCRRFAMWLAATLEVLAGCESSDQNVTIDAAEKLEHFSEDLNADPTSMDVSERLLAISEDGVSDVQQSSTGEKLESLIQSLIQELEDSEKPKARKDFMLAISEMCRLAQRTIMENINQSLNSTESSGSRKHNKNSDIFASSFTPSRTKGLSEQDCKVSDRFMVSASRVLALYAMNLGSKAALLSCKHFYSLANQGGEDLPEAPRPDILSILEIAKEASIDCANIYGGDIRAGPIPDPPMDELDSLNTGGGPYIVSGSTRNFTTGVKGLSLDVERMFTEKVATYPHPSHIVDFSRNAVVFIVLKVAFNAILEQTRCCTFQTKGYRQLQVDILLLRYLLPHYVKDDKQGEGRNALTVLDHCLNDIMSNAGERCMDLDCVGQSTFYNPTTDETTTIQSIVRDFMRDNEDVLGDSSDKHDAKEKIVHPKSKFLIELAMEG